MPTLEEIRDMFDACFEVGLDFEVCLRSGRSLILTDRPAESGVLVGVDPQNSVRYHTHFTNVV